MFLSSKISHSLFFLYSKAFRYWWLSNELGSGNKKALFLQYSISASVDAPQRAKIISEL